MVCGTHWPARSAPGPVWREERRTTIRTLLLPLDDFHLAVLLAICLHAGFAGVRVNLSLFALSLKASPFTVGVILSLLALLPTLFSVHTGRVIDRIGVRRPLVVGTVTVIGGILLGFLVPRLEMLFLVSCLVGSGFMLFHIAINNMAGEMGHPPCC